MPLEACFHALGRRQCAGAIADCGLRLRDRLKGRCPGLTIAGCRDRREGSCDACARRFGIAGRGLRLRDPAKRGCPRVAVRECSGQGKGRGHGLRGSRLVARLVQEPGDPGKRRDPTRMVIDAVRRPHGARQGRQDGLPRTRLGRGTGGPGCLGAGAGTCRGHSGAPDSGPEGRAECPAAAPAGSPLANTLAVFINDPSCVVGGVLSHGRRESIRLGPNAPGCRAHFHPVTGLRQAPSIQADRRPALRQHPGLDRRNARRQMHVRNSQHFRVAALHFLTPVIVAEADRRANAARDRRWVCGRQPQLHAHIEQFLQRAPHRVQRKVPLPDILQKLKRRVVDLRGRPGRILDFQHHQVAIANRPRADRA